MTINWDRVYEKWYVEQPVEDHAWLNDAEAGECDAFQAAWDRLHAGLHRISADTIGAVRPGQAECWLGAGLVSVRTPSTRGCLVREGGSKRGKVSEFTKKSRLRLLRTIAKVRRSELPLFVTLTYPGEWPESDRAWKNHLRVLWARVRRRWPGAAAVWRLEFQKRGAPHFHLLLYGVPLYDVACPLSDTDKARWFDRAWYEVVGSGDERHLRAGVNVAPVRSFEGVMHYAAKYVTKPDSGRAGMPDRGFGSEADELGGDGVGRFWGVLGRANMPYGVKLLVRLVGPEAWNLRRALSRVSGIIPRSRKGLTCFASGDVWARFVEEGHCLGPRRGEVSSGRYARMAEAKNKAAG